jgi:hypothetical protein
LVGRFSVGRRGFERVNDLPTLTILDVSRCTQPWLLDEAFDALWRCDSLTALSMRVMLAKWITNSARRSIAQLPALTRLDDSYCTQFLQSEFTALATSRALTELIADSCDRLDVLGGLCA